MEKILAIFIGIILIGFGINDIITQKAYIRSGGWADGASAIIWGSLMIVGG